MADLGINSLKTQINETITENGNQEITGAILNDDLIDMVDTLKNGANIDANSVDTAQLKDGAVTASKIANGTITTAKLGDGMITSGKVANGAIGTTQLADSSVKTAKLDNVSVTTGKLANGSVTADKIAASAVTTVKIADSAITTAKIADESVTTDKIAVEAIVSEHIGAGEVKTDNVDASAVTTAKIADSAVTTDKIQASAVTNGKIADNAVTPYKLADGLSPILNVNEFLSYSGGYASRSEFISSITSEYQMPHMMITWGKGDEDGIDTWITEQFIGSVWGAEDAKWMPIAPVTVSQNTTTKATSIQIGDGDAVSIPAVTTVEQTLTSEQQEQAKSNIGVIQKQFVLQGKDNAIIATNLFPVIAGHEYAIEFLNSEDVVYSTGTLTEYVLYVRSTNSLANKTNFTTRAGITKEQYLSDSSKKQIMFTSTTDGWAEIGGRAKVGSIQLFNVYDITKQPVDSKPIFFSARGEILITLNKTAWTVTLTIPNNSFLRIAGQSITIPETTTNSLAYAATPIAIMLLYKVSNSTFRIANYNAQIELHDEIVIDFIRVIHGENSYFPQGFVCSCLTNNIYKIVGTPYSFDSLLSVSSIFSEKSDLALSFDFTKADLKKWITGAGIYQTQHYRIQLTKYIPASVRYLHYELSVNSDSPYEIGIQTRGNDNATITTSEWVTAGTSKKYDFDMNGLYPSAIVIIVQRDSNTTPFEWEDVESYFTVSILGYENFDDERFALKQQGRIANAFGRPSFEIIAHRGWHMQTIPEDSLDAYRMAALMGYRYCETDVHLTSDNVVVVCHDASINRTYRNADYTTISETVNISSKTYQQLVDGYVQISDNPKYRKPIPTLEEFLILCRKYKLYPIIEIKDNVDALTLATYNLAHKYLGDNFGFTGFHYRQLDYGRTLNDNILIIYIGTGIRNTTNSYDGTSSRNKVKNVWFPWSGYTPVMSASEVNAYHDLNMGVCCYPETNEEYDMLSDYGCDWAMSNYISPIIEGNSAIVFNSDFGWDDFKLSNGIIQRDTIAGTSLILDENESISVQLPSAENVALFVEIQCKGNFEITMGLGVSSVQRNKVVIASEKISEHCYGLMLFNADAGINYVTSTAKPVAGAGIIQIKSTSNESVIDTIVVNAVKLR